MGLAYSLYDANFPPKAKWTASYIPDLTNKVAIVTGGNSGIGKETVKALLTKNAKVYIAARNETSCKEIIHDLKQVTGREARFLQLDLANLSQVKASVKDFQTKEKELHILICNAGVMVPPIEAVTEDRYDLQFGVNVIGHYLFTRLLIPQLAAAQSSRVVIVSSNSHLLTPGIDYETLHDGPARRKMGSLDLYNQSKLANVMCTFEFARRYGGQGIVFTATHPGLIRTNLNRHMSKFMIMLTIPFVYTPAEGALTQLYAATSSETATANGKYFNPWGRIGTPNPVALENKPCIELWDWLEKETAKFVD